MARLSIDAIASSPTAYRLRRSRIEALNGFESVSMARAEDHLRIRRARHLTMHSVNAPAIRRLIQDITRSVRRNCRSLASATYMRDLRQRAAGQLWWLVARTSNLRPRTFTLFPRGWEVPAGQLHTFDPVRKLAALRSLINRCGGHQAGGYLVLFIHGEFDPVREVYQLHGHGLAAGNFWIVMDEGVRKSPSVRSSGLAYGHKDFVRFRLRMDQQLTDLPRPLTYLVKSYWPCKKQYRDSEGKLRRQRRATRIPEPHHTEVLLWLNRWHLSDLTLMMNLSVDRTGFRLADRAYTNGDNQ